MLLILVLLVPVRPTSARTYYCTTSWIRSISTRPRGDQVVLLVDVLETWTLPDAGEYREASRNNVGAASFGEAIRWVEGGRHIDAGCLPVIDRITNKLQTDVKMAIADRRRILGHTDSGVAVGCDGGGRSDPNAVPRGRSDLWPFVHNCGWHCVR